jgi:hypothetical protein
MVRAAQRAPEVWTLGTVEVDEEGKFVSKFNLPDDVQVGKFNVFLEGVDAEGLDRQVAMGIELVGADVELDMVFPAAQFDMASMNGFGLAGAAAMAGLFWFVIGRRRIDEDDDEYIDFFGIARDS